MEAGLGIKQDDYAFGSRHLEFEILIYSKFWVEKSSRNL